MQVRINLQVVMHALRNVCRFGTESLNLRVSIKDPLTEERLDSNFDRYGHLFRAFVLRRRLLRSEIWPKIHILEDSPNRQHLAYQSLFEMKKSMRDETMQAIARNDPSKINSAFIISNFCEDHLKEMLDEYVSKVLVCGKAPSDQEATLRLESTVLDLYRAFYLGQRGTALERELEQSFLSVKQFKYLRAERQKRANYRFVEEVKWTEKDQRVLEEKQNWMPANPNLSDLNYRTFFERLEYPTRVGSFLKMQKLQRPWNWVEQLKFRWLTSKYYDPRSSRFYDWVQDKLFVRIMNHVRSTEFTSTMNIAHDYMIQAQVIQVHFWLVINRLTQIATKSSLVLARRLEQSLNTEMVRSAQSVNLKKSNVLTSSLERMLETNKALLQLHFNRSELTRNNPCYGIDALVWSIVMAEKVHRYADQIYLFSDYLLQNFYHLQRHSLEDFLDGIVEFDPFLIRPRYRQLIEAVNPPLSSAEFEKQFRSNDPRKDYYYSKLQTEMEEKGGFDHGGQQGLPEKRFSLLELLQPFRNLRMKYQTLDTMDHFNKMEEQKREEEKLEKKGTWRSQRDDVAEVSSSFSEMQGLKNRRRRRIQDQTD